MRPARLPARLGAAAARRRPRLGEGRAQADAGGGALRPAAAPQALEQLRRRGVPRPSQPAAARGRHPRLPRAAPQRAVGHRHHRDGAPERRQGLPEPGDRLLRRQAGRLVEGPVFSQ